jgi:hypothetical protein
MATDAIKGWLKRRQHQAFTASLLYSFAALAGGLVICLLEFGLLFLVSKLFVLMAIPLTLHANLWSLPLAAIFSALLVADCLRAYRDDMSVIPLWLAREFVHIGPRLILDGIHRMVHARQLLQIDLELGAKVLAYLAPKGTPTSREEMLRDLPGLAWPSLVAQLGLIQGVIFFRHDANRVILTLPLRLELRQLLKSSQVHAEEEPEPIPVDEPEKLGPREILGVSATASVAEIKIAYRNRVKECHPDRFAHLDEQSRELAEEWTKALNAAYHTLLTGENARND